MEELQFSADWKQSKEGLADQVQSSKACFQWSTTSDEAPFSKVSSTSPNSNHQLGTKHSTHEPVGDIS
jgi:hypothetical protein